MHSLNGLRHPRVSANTWLSRCPSDTKLGACQIGIRAYLGLHSFHLVVIILHATTIFHLFKSCFPVIRIMDTSSGNMPRGPRSGLMGEIQQLTSALQHAFPRNSKQSRTYMEIARNHSVIEMNVVVLMRRSRIGSRRWKILWTVCPA